MNKQLKIQLAIGTVMSILLGISIGLYIAAAFIGPELGK
jgi:uncharacterized protein YneF (UPF0154 family)